VVWTFVTSSVEWLESDWKHGGTDVLHERREANADIDAGEIVLELEPAGGDLKPTTSDVENLRGNIVLGLKLLGEPYRSYSGDLQGPENHFDELSFAWGAPSLLEHPLGDVTLTAVGPLIVPNVRELSGPGKWGLQLFHRDESLMLPEGYQALNMSSLIPGVAVLGSQSSSLED